MSEDQFTKLFVYMERRFDAIDDRFVEVDRKFDRVYNTLDSMAADIEAIKTELVSVRAHLHRHDQAIDQLAQHTGLRIHYQ